MLPEAKHGPAVPSQLSGDVAITSHISQYFFSPELLRRHLAVSVVVSVPKVSITEHGNTHLDVCKVRMPQHVRIHFEFDSCVGQN